MSPGEHMPQMISQVEYLSRMGIDVWVSRGRHTETLQAPQAETLAESAEASIVTDAVVSDQQASEQPSFFFCFLHYGDLGIACLLPPQDRRMSTGCRRFSDDVAFAVQADRKSSTIVDLHWPLVESGAIDQSTSAAKHLVNQNFSRLPVNTIVFGTGFAQYVLDVEDIVVGQCYQSNGRRVLVADEVSLYRGNPARKRELWQALKEAKLGNGYSSI